MKLAKQTNMMMHQRMNRILVARQSILSKVVVNATCPTRTFHTKLFQPIVQQQHNQRASVLCVTQIRKQHQDNKSKHEVQKYLRKFEEMKSKGKLEDFREASDLLFASGVLDYTTLSTVTDDIIKQIMKGRSGSNAIDPDHLFVPVILYFSSRNEDNYARSFLFLDKLASIEFLSSHTMNYLIKSAIKKAEYDFADMLSKKADELGMSFSLGEYISRMMSYVEMNRTNEAVDLFNDLTADGTKLHDDFYSKLLEHLKQYSRRSDRHNATINKILEHLRSRRLTNQVLSYSIMAVLGTMGDVEGAEQWIQIISKSKDVNLTENHLEYLLLATAKSKGVSSALDVIQQMSSKYGIPPSTGSFNYIIPRCESTSEFKQVIEAMKNANVEPDISFQHQVILFLCNHKRYDEALQLYEQIRTQPDFRTNYHSTYELVLAFKDVAVIVNTLYSDSAKAQDIYSARLLIAFAKYSSEYRLYLSNHLRVANRDAIVHLNKRYPKLLGIALSVMKQKYDPLLREVEKRLEELRIPIAS
jgi:hypothetical protein